MKDFKINILKILFVVSEKTYWGIICFFASPVVHSLHRILPDEILKRKIQYHQIWYFFLWSIEHSLAPAVALFGCFLLIPGRVKYLVGVPFGYQLYKAFEKIPIREDYDPHQEFLIIAILFSIGAVVIFWILDKIIFKINHEVRHSIITLKYIAELAQNNEIDNKELGRETEKQANKLEKQLELT